jgi:tetratricopeptide (TPR) repeat protein
MNQALDIAKEINDKPGIAQQYNNIAVMYFSSYKDYPKALSYFKSAYQVNHEIGETLQAGINLLNIGHCHFEMHKNDSAIPYYTRSLKIFREAGNPFRIANSEIALGNYYKEINEFNQSLNHAQEALKIALHLDSKELIVDASDILRNIYLLNGDTVTAFRYSEIRSQAKDSLLVLKSQNNLYKLAYQYNYEKLDKQRKLKQLRSNYIMGFIILGLLSSMFIVLLIYSRQRIKVKNTNLEKEKMASDLNFKNKELTINLMALMKKNEMLSEISSKLVAIEKRMPKDEFRENIAKLKKEVTRSADEKIWKEFSLRFQQTNSDFYENLREKYPDLTQSELRLSAYLRLNMTSKEISEITGQRILTLESARYRLRKKLGISGSDSNLVAFLSQI